MPVHHKNDPKRFSDDFATKQRWDLSKSLFLCEIMQKRIPKDTRKSHFSTWGRKRNRFCVKGKNFVSNRPPLHCFKLTKEQVFHICIHVFALSCFFPTAARYSAKKRLNGPEWQNWSNSNEVPLLPPPLVPRLLRERWSMIIDSARIEFPKKVAKRMNLQSRTLKKTKLLPFKKWPKLPHKVCHYTTILP